MNSAPVIENTKNHDEDIAAITRIIEDTQTAYNTNDAELLTKHFARNGSAVNVMGMRTAGRDAVLEANRKGLAGFLHDQYVRYEISDLLFVRPDVAIVGKHARAATAGGELIDIDHVMVAVYVLVKEDGRWWIVARQNTLVPKEN
jgi:uncharacterized protein (TIGR02246 family)